MSARHELADFAPDTGHLHACTDRISCDCAAWLYCLAAPLPAQVDLAAVSNPAIAAIAVALGVPLRVRTGIKVTHRFGNWLGPGQFASLRVVTKALDALLDSPEALRWIGANVEPETLGYERCGYTWITTQGRQWSGPKPLGHPTEVPAYLAPRREEVEHAYS